MNLFAQILLAGAVSSVPGTICDNERKGALDASTAKDVKDLQTSLPPLTLPLPLTHYRPFIS